MDGNQAAVAGHLLESQERADGAHRLTAAAGLLLESLERAVDGDQAVAGPLLESQERAAQVEAAGPRLGSPERAAVIIAGLAAAAAGLAVANLARVARDTAAHLIGAILPVQASLVRVALEMAAGRAAAASPQRIPNQSAAKENGSM